MTMQQVDSGTAAGGQEQMEQARTREAAAGRMEPRAQRRWAVAGLALALAVAIGLGVRQTGWPGGTRPAAVPNQSAGAVESDRAPGRVAEGRRRIATLAESTRYTVYLTDSEPLAAWLREQYGELNEVRAAAGQPGVGVEVQVIHSADEDMRVQEQIAQARQVSRYVAAPELRVVDLRAP